jgi:alpha-tubulin suppressor-like RCC1 family protein
LTPPLDGCLTAPYYVVVETLEVPMPRRRSLCVLLCAALAAGCSEGTSPTPAIIVAVTSVSPSSGPLIVGTAVTIRGSNFPARIDSVRFGYGHLGNVIRVSDTLLSGLTPAVSAQAVVDVTVYTTTAGVGTCSLCFTYDSTIAVTWRSLTAGAAHTCGVASSGTAYCWGEDFYDQLGTTAALGSCNEMGFPPHPYPWPFPCSWTPVAVAGDLAFASLSAGAFHTCGLTAGGAAYCWGTNDFGQLGIGYTVRAVPAAVQGGIAFASLATRYLHSCGLTTSGAAYCWGSNYAGQLGDGTTSNRVGPVAVSGGHVYTAVSVGSEHTCGLATDGAAYCWGSNSSGQLGDGTISPRSSPVAVSGGLSFQVISAGGGYTCGIATGGAAYCWGANGEGQLGKGDTFGAALPAAVLGGITFSRLTAFSHTCGVASGGTAYCWGSNVAGQLGTDAPIGNSSSRPVPVAGRITFMNVTAGAYHTCGLSSDGVAYCWGLDDEGQLGDGVGVHILTPRAMVAR